MFRIWGRRTLPNRASKSPNHCLFPPRATGSHRCKGPGLHWMGMDVDSTQKSSALAMDNTVSGGTRYNFRPQAPWPAFHVDVLPAATLQLTHRPTRLQRTHVYTCSNLIGRFRTIHDAIWAEVAMAAWMHARKAARDPCPCTDKDRWQGLVGAIFGSASRLARSAGLGDPCPSSSKSHEPRATTPLGTSQTDG